MVGATGFEPVTSSVSAKHREPLCKTPFSRSRPTVDGLGKRSLDLKGNALFPTSCRGSVTITSRPLAAAMQQRRVGGATTQQLSSA